MSAPSLPLDAITVEGRHRKDLGDLQALADSIKTVGLLHPVVVTPDGQLVAGQRRVEAVKLLGWQRVPVTVMADLDDAARLLRAESDENACRKPFTPVEAEAIAGEIEKILKPVAEARRQATQGRPKTGADSAPVSDARIPKTRDIAAEAVGYSRDTIAKVRSVREAAEDPDAPEAVREAAERALASMDEDGSVHAAWKSVIEAKAAQPPERERAPDEPLPEPKAARKRKPLPDVELRLSVQQDAVLDGYRRLLKDDRWGSNRKSLEPRVRRALQQTIFSARELLDELAPEDFPQQEEPPIPIPERN
ncbi:ParB domain protein nuclease [Segniliparus rotundus DSM 44985]|uniref:ParB domain protein nuclease n=1 Tax=Segniliparus rotundus (strain ATCC BAA-972 / CDC 1076 / CIP 108378 / DSM 44985 / JCM 13578) TaxID=640132 RepID=D6ZFD4_SEGRD|nr:ParB N-terminal domain-containing protein [Segniliparus rotundus]ADG97658.1 ParB domain protein nuclease [Segniliparus rotundus DSM 44985]